jgi:predicted dehydrogenase
MDRRTFVTQSGVAMMAAGMTARSYARILGANDRVNLGIVGCGSRSEDLVSMAQISSRTIPLDVVAVCDLWNAARDRRAEQVKKELNQEPRKYQYLEQMLGHKELDGVMIATGDFQHAKLCVDVVQAGKDCYVEKPFANVLSEAKQARDAVKTSKQVVQMGTQHRGQPYNLAVRDLIRAGRIGKVVHIEQEWNVNQERWRFVDVDTGISPERLIDKDMQWKKWLYEAKSQLREEDTDWKRWLLDKPYRPFDPHVYLEFRLYKDFSAGLFDQWLSHASDLVHLWTDEAYPLSVMSNGGVFAWPDGRENPDTCVTAITYPKGFLYTYKTTFGNSYRSFSRIQGRDGTIENHGGEGASLFVVTEEGGRREFDGHTPTYTNVPLIAPEEDREQVVRVPGAPSPDSNGPDDVDAPHLLNWLDAMRERKQPCATVDHGFSHSIVCIMAAQSYWSGKKLFWDPVKEEITDVPVQHKVS